jgi:heptosyltransferase-2
MGIIDGIKAKYPDSEIHWIARKDMSSFLAMDPRIDKIWGFDKSTGFKGLYKYAKELKKENFDFVYDAHSNIRSNILRLVIAPRFKRIFGIGPKFCMRSKDRLKRILLFKFRIDLFPMPFKGVESFRKPLSKFGINEFPSSNIDWYFPESNKNNVNSQIIDNCKDRICLIPSAAWEMKRWPIEYWKDLIKILDEYKFIVLGGPEDKFCEEIANIAPNRVINMAGKTNLLESCYIVSQSKFAISGDTGFLHAADKFLTPGIAIIGPSAFGYPTGKHIELMQSDLKCIPCSKDGSGKCKQKEYKKCLFDIKPKMLAEIVKKNIVK